MGHREAQALRSAPVRGSGGPDSSLAGLVDDGARRLVASRRALTRDAATKNWNEGAESVPSDLLAEALDMRHWTVVAVRGDDREGP